MSNARKLCAPFVATIALSLAACSQNGPQLTGAETGALTGSALGAGLGAIVGNQSGHTGGGIAIGAAAGALGGALIGGQSDRQENRTRAQDEQIRRQEEEIRRQQREIDDIRRGQGSDPYYRSNGNGSGRSGSNRGTGDRYDYNDQGNSGYDSRY